MPTSLAAASDAIAIQLATSSTEYISETESSYDELDEEWCVVQIVNSLVPGAGSAESQNIALGSIEWEEPVVRPFLKSVQVRLYIGFISFAVDNLPKLYIVSKYGGVTVQPRYAVINVYKEEDRAKDGAIRNPNLNRHLHRFFIAKMDNLKLPNQRVFDPLQKVAPYPNTVEFVQKTLVNHANKVPYEQQPRLASSAPLEGEAPYMVSISDLRYADLQACCVCIGFKDEDVYKVDADAEASLRSILRYLRAESSSCDIRRELGRLKIITSDLLPLMKTPDITNALFDLTIRLLVNLTQPAIVCFRHELPKDRDLYTCYMQVDNLLKDCKKAFADEQAFRVLASRVENLFNKTWVERSNDDRLLIERILILIRNVLHITPDTSSEHRTDEDVSVHDQLLWAMHLSGWDELLLFMANAEDERDNFAFHTLEIISLMLREQTPELLASAGKPADVAAAMNPESKVLERLRLREKEWKRAALVELNMRHNRFGGTFELLNTKSLSDRPLIYHHDVTAPLMCAKMRHDPIDGTESSGDVGSLTADVGLVDLNLGKTVRRKARNRKPLLERDLHRRSIFAVQLYLQNFCWQFLCNCYNPLMNAARSAILRQTTQANDETYYLWAMHFFMAFCRLYNFRAELVSETLSVPVFHWVYQLSMSYREAVLADRKGGGTNVTALHSSRRLALAVSAYRQFLLSLQEMTRPGSTVVTPAALICQENPEERSQRLKAHKQAAESLMGTCSIASASRFIRVVRSGPGLARSAVDMRKMQYCSFFSANIFYIADYLDLYPLLLREYNESVQTKQYLIDLAEGANLFLNLISAQEKTNKTLVVSQRQRRRRRTEEQRKKREQQKQRRRELQAARRRAQRRAGQTPEERAAERRLVWTGDPAAGTNNTTSLSYRLLRLLADQNGSLQTAENAEELPQLFDPTAETEADDRDAVAAQLRNAIRLVHTALQEGRLMQALRIARLMWEIWPESAPTTATMNEQDEHDDDGQDMTRALEAGLAPSAVSEFIALKRIFMLDLVGASDFVRMLFLTGAKTASNSAQEELEALKRIGEDITDDAEEEEEDLIARELEDSDDEFSVINKEVSLDLDNLLLKFAHAHTIRNLTLLLENYALNPPTTNDCLVRLFHRVAVRRRLPGACFQVRLFRVFQSIVNDPGISKQDEFQELLKFIKYILRKFFEAFERNRNVSVEALFLKSAKESFEAFNGYGTFDAGSRASVWTPELDQELGQLFDAYRFEPVPKGTHYSPACFYPSILRPKEWLFYFNLPLFFALFFNIVSVTLFVRSL
ncbi:unnamed protein product [Schistocephalus solidus]|uniref:TIMELESS domain-containing protein n=1 Tax=Schistocephalus solidus TaxID=70667 RepID=A0A183SX01_SCHSO|nr:unnamed protein product [Schistocephalus solidus]